MFIVVPFISSTGLVVVAWECLVFDFSFFSVKSCLFKCLSVMRCFSLQIFSFLISVWLILSFCCVHFYSFVQFYWGVGRCTSEFALECSCLNKVVLNK